MTEPTGMVIIIHQRSFSTIVWKTALSLTYNSDTLVLQQLAYYQKDSLHLFQKEAG